MEGQVVGSYRIIEKIGEGGMGTVYRGVDMMLEREVAIKVLRPELIAETAIVERFRKEAVTLARLNHPRIAMLYSFFREGNDLFMVMEYVAGETLEHHIERTGRMAPAEAIQLYGQALEGIGHAHQLGIVHRDIKPANIMITPAGTIKVMDFGIARVLGTARTTRTGRLIGTLEYMAPEQVKGAGGDERSDIYALGILLYEMVTGQVPFGQHSDFELMRAQVEAAPPPPRTLVTDLPEAIERVILKTLEKDPGDRYQTVGALRAAVDSCLEALGTAPPPAVEAVPPPRATRAATAAEAAGASEPKATRVATEAEQPAPHVPKATRAAEAVTAETPVVPGAPQGVQASLLVERLSNLGMKHYAGLAAVVVIAVMALLWWPQGEPPRAPANDDEAVAMTTDTTDEAVSSQGFSTNEPPPSNSMARPAPVDPEVPETTQPSAPVGEVLGLLATARQLFAADRLTSPPGENALESCNRALALDPGNGEALALIHDIAQRYAQWGDSRLSSGSIAEAVTFYQKSLDVEDDATVATKLANARHTLSLASETNEAARPAEDTERSTPPETRTEQPARSDGRAVTLPAGTKVRLRLAKALSVDDGDREGGRVVLEVVDPVVVQGRTAIRKGASARGVITTVRRARRLLRGEMGFRLHSVEAADGQTIILRSVEFSQKAGRGQEASIPAGGVYEGLVARDTMVSR